MCFYNRSWKKRNRRVVIIGVLFLMFLLGAGLGQERQQSLYARHRSIAPIPWKPPPPSPWLPTPCCSSATRRAFRGSRDALLPRPKWMPSSPSARVSTQQAIHQLRAEVGGPGLGVDNFSGFASSLPAATSPQKSSFPLATALCYANA
jgi:hypothetical protein